LDSCLGLQPVISHAAFSYNATGRLNDMVKAFIVAGEYRPGSVLKIVHAASLE